MNFPSALISIISAFLLNSPTAHADQITITGVAARTLFICDDFAQFDCWFAEGVNACTFAISSEPEIQESGQRRLVVRGELAEKIYTHTHYCYNGRRPGEGLRLGREGIKCYPSNYSYACWLDVDAIFTRP